MVIVTLVMIVVMNMVLGVALMAASAPWYKCLFLGLQIKNKVLRILNCSKAARACAVGR